MDRDKVVDTEFERRRALCSLDTRRAGDIMIAAFDQRLFSDDGGRERWAILLSLTSFKLSYLGVLWAIYSLTMRTGVKVVQYWVEGKAADFEQIYETAHPLWYRADVAVCLTVRETRHG